MSENKIRRNISLNREAIWSEEFSLEQLPEGMQAQCQLHGLAQKLTDCTAGMSEAKGHTTEERRGKITELYAQIGAGDWNKRSEGAGTKLSQTQIKSKMEELGLSDEQYELAKKMGLIKG
jgi:hypothetical protein